MKGTAVAGHGGIRRAAGALFVLTLVVLGAMAGQHYLARPGSGAAGGLANGAPPADVQVEAGGVPAPCGSCDARHGHISRLREAGP